MSSKRFILCLLCLAVAMGTIGGSLLKKHIPAVTLNTSFSVDAVITTETGKVIISGGASDLMVTDLVTGQTGWQPMLSYRIADTFENPPSSGSWATERPLAVASP